jgi:hypothetical protein
MQKFYFRKPKHHEKKMAGILLRDKTSGGPVMSQPIRFQYVGVCILARLPYINTESYLYVYSILTCTKDDLHSTFWNMLGSVCIADNLNNAKT